jgi:hypothetical protein
MMVIFEQLKATFEHDSFSTTQGDFWTWLIFEHFWRHGYFWTVPRQFNTHFGVWNHIYNSSYNTNYLYIRHTTYDIHT